MKQHFFYTTDFGTFGMVAADTGLTQLYFPDEVLPENILLDSSAKETELLQEAAAQLREYLSGQRRQFSLLLAPAGTSYLIRVWQKLVAIPYGETRSYQDIARMLGNPQAARAVGLANNRNPLPIFIPCHRVIGANQKLTGYRGGLELKRKLLELEQHYAHI